MSKHYLSDQARGLAMAARSEDEKNLITQMANELDSMWTMCNSQAKEITALNGRLDAIVEENNALVDKAITPKYSQKTKGQKIAESRRKAGELKAYIKANDTRTYNALMALYRRNDTPQSMWERVKQTDFSTMKNVGAKTKSNIYQMFKDLGVANG
jgi:septal ring factor EnvC (AmiA/AmiB activator)